MRPKHLQVKQAPAEIVKPGPAAGFTHPVKGARPVRQAPSNSSLTKVKPSRYGRGGFAARAKAAKEMRGY